VLNRPVLNRPVPNRPVLNHRAAHHVVTRVAYLWGRRGGWRRPLLLAGGAAMIGIVALGPAASADVKIVPGEGIQGGTSDVTFAVGNDRPGVHTTKVRIEFPPSTPIAEVDPLSSPNWAPTATTRTLDRPVQGIHFPLRTSTSAMDWVRVDDPTKPEAAPKVEELRMVMGAMPKTDNVVFTVVQTYSDAKTKRWSAVLRLTPAAAQTPAADGQEPTAVAQVPAQGQHGHGGQVTAAQAGSPGAGSATDDDRGRNLALIGAGIVGGLLIGGLGALTVINRSRTETDLPDLPDPPAKSTAPAPAPADDAGSLTKP
jgi:uncharacterized protein YcnI